MEELRRYNIVVDEIITCSYSILANSPKEAIDRFLEGDESVYLEGEEGQGYIDSIPFAVHEASDYDNMTYFDTNGNEYEHQ